MSQRLLLIVRSAFFNAYLYALTVALLLLFLPFLAGPRNWILGAARFWIRAVTAGHRVLAGTHYEIRGLDRIPEGPVIIASKHQSMWDTIIYNLILRDPAVVLKRELLFIPFFGWYLLKLGMVPIHRGGHAAALKAMIRAAKERLSQGRQVVVFPEGTRVPPGQSRDYKVGVAALYRQLGVPCVPVALNSGLFWGRRQFLRRPGTIVLEFLEPIAPGLDRKQFMSRLEQRIQAGTEHLEQEAMALRGAESLGETSSTARES